MSGVKVLLIDDELAIFEPLSALMAHSGYLLHFATNGHEGIKQFDQIKPDIVLLDISMPGMNGMEVCEHIRKKSSVPVIMLSARSEEMDILHGFHVGIDDYLTKPFSFAILQARIKAVLARTKYAGQPQPETFVSEDLAINFERKHVTVGGSSVRLTPTEYRLLEVLSKHAHRTIPVSQLLRDVWGQHYEGEPQYVKQFVWSLRKKIEDNPYEPKHLTTQRGFGYRFD